MAVGVSGGNDQGAPLEVQFSVAREVGLDVLKTAHARGEFTVQGERPSILFLEPEKLSKDYIDGLEPSGQVDRKSIEAANTSSLGLSIEAALQVIDAKSNGNRLVEDTDSLSEIVAMFRRCEAFVSDQSRTDTESVITTATDIANRHNLQVTGNEAILSFANESLIKARQRLEKKIQLIEQL